MSCSRETCFSAFSWRSAPTKSRLTFRPPRCSFCASENRRPEKKRGGHPRHGAAVQFAGVYTRRGGPPPVGAPPTRRAVPALDVGLEQLDELRDEPVAPERSIELAVDEDRRNGRLERSRQRD